MAPGMAPTPFTAKQIREGCPDGRHAVSVAVNVDGTATTEEVRFENGDSEGVSVQVEGTTHRVSWRELQSHASFPEEETQVQAETITTPLGSFVCLHYTVTRGSATYDFWFAIDLPGMPILRTVTVEGRVTLTVTMIANETP